MADNTLLITGIPRSGTTLVVKLLNEIPDLVALNEPMPVMEMAGLTESGLFRWMNLHVDRYRNQLVVNGKAETKHIDGIFTDNSFDEALNEQGLRPSKASSGLVDVTKPLTDQFTLAIKHNGAFTAHAHFLTRKYQCFAVVRNPLSVILSWQTVDIPVNFGRMPVAEAIDPELHSALNRIGNNLERQIFIINWFFDRFHRFFSSENIIRYETLVSVGGSALGMITPNAGLITTRMSSRNTSKLYKTELIDETTEKLLKTGGPFTRFYSAADIEAIYTEYIQK